MLELVADLNFLNCRCSRYARSVFMRVLFLLFLICSFSSVHADFIWPTAFLAERWFSIPAIVAGLLIEIGFVRYFSKVDWRKSVIVGAAMNIASATVGAVFSLIVGLFASMLLYTPIALIFDAMKSKTDVMVLYWLIGYLCSILVNVWIEGTIIQKTIKLSLSKTFRWLFFANAISIGMCLICFAIDDSHWISLPKAIGIPIFVMCIYGAYLAYCKFIKKKEI